MLKLTSKTALFSFHVFLKCAWIHCDVGFNPTINTDRYVHICDILKFRLIVGFFCIIRQKIILENIHLIQDYLYVI